jgi:formamidopyrimidine-DNA glycosylase
VYDREEHEKIIGKLGMDLFSENFTLENFKNIFKNKNTLVAGLLLKQEIMCGIGNYIKNESMYLTQLKAKIKTSELSDNQIELLYKNILFVGYSNLIEMLSDSKILKYLEKSKKTYMPKKLEIPYEYKIYGR